MYKSEIYVLTARLRGSVVVMCPSGIFKLLAGDILLFWREIFCHSTSVSLLLFLPDLVKGFY